MTTSWLDGFAYGLVATVAMTSVMLLGIATRTSPMPVPIPLALAKWAFGAHPYLPILGMLTHFLYGGVAGAVYLQLRKTRSKPWEGLLWAIILWLIMQIVWFPLIGWGAFGIAINHQIWAATLALHLIYGAVLGWGLASSQAWQRHDGAAPAGLP